MNFILSPEMIDDIIFAMENQNDHYVFDSAEGFCVNTDTEAYNAENTGNTEGRYYDIPHWTSADGFRIMEQFTAQVHNPLLREELRTALNQKKGVFRRFKSALKINPAVEQGWYRFKERQMKAAVYEWYNDLRICWGLEKIRFEEDTEETGTLLPQDFTFDVKRQTSFEDALLPAFMQKIDREIRGRVYEGISISSLAKSGVLSVFTVCTDALLSFKAADRENVMFTVHAGEELCALSALCKIDRKNCFTIPFLQVLPDYRGLGIGKELLQRACIYADERQAGLVFADMFTSAHFIPQLEQHGFQQIGLLYVR